MVLAGGEAFAQDTFINQNISGFNLPGVQLPQGHDEVRAADGTTCRSAVSGSGAYVDVGVIGNPERSETEGSMSAYGRLVIPLGSGVKRLDCSRLYDLEVRRLEMELRLMQMGLTRGIAPVSDGEAVASDAEPATVIAESETKVAKEAPKEVKVASSKASGKQGGSSWADDGWTTEGLKK